MTSPLNAIDFASLSPLLYLIALALLLLLWDTFSPATAKKYIPYAIAIGLGLAFAIAYEAPSSTNSYLTFWLNFGAVSRFFTLFFISIGVATALLSIPFFKQFDPPRGEYGFLLVSALFGLVLIGMSADFLTLFIGLETLSIALYILCGYMKKWEFSQEAALKYFLMGALAAAFLLYGIAFIYGATGTTQFAALLPAFQKLAPQSKTLFFAGIALVTVGLAFKAALVPFHVWAPDVYDGAPNPVTAFMAVGTKAGAFAAFALIFLVALPNFNALWNHTVALLAYPTLIYANFVALRQTQLRRFFAYSGISHAGFLLLPLAAGTPDALPAMLFYLVVYALATLAAFAILAFLDRSSQGVTFDDLRGLYARAPLLSAGLALSLLTLAGIPPTIGFFAKFYLFKVAYEAGYTLLVIVALLTTILSAYYYLRLTALLFNSNPADTPITRSRTAGVVAALALAGILALSLYPQLLNFLWE